MMDKTKIGFMLPAAQARVEAGQLKLFSKATGQTDPVYLNSEAAQAAGYRDILAPPTFVTCLYMLGRGDPAPAYKALGVRMERVLHAEQRFELHEPICAGDDISFETKVADIFSKKDGALEFLVQESKALNQFGRHAATALQTIVVRN